MSIKRRVLVLLISIPLILALLLPSATVQAKGWGRLKNGDKILDKIFEKAGKVLKDESDLKFNDWKEAEWALGAVARLRALGIISGYPGDIFKPQNPVSQVEALAMMTRAFGLEDDANELARKFAGFYSSLGETGGKKSGNSSEQEDEAVFITSQGMKLPVLDKSNLWGLGYVLLAVDQGWVTLQEIEPAKPASRAWVAMVMVRALGYEDEAEARMGVRLSFRDAPSIPQNAVGYVAEAIELGLFQGYEDNTFRPQKPVTRAEMALILDRFLENGLPDETQYMVRGTVNGISGSYITLTLSSGASVTYRISPDALVTFEKQRGTLDDVRPGDKVQVLTNGQGVVLLIDVKSRSTPYEGISVTGQVISVATNAYGEISLTLNIPGEGSRTIPLSQDCKVTYGNSLLKPSDIMVGDQVTIVMRSGTGTAVNIISRRDDSVISGTVQGKIVGISLSTNGVFISVKDASGKVAQVPIRPDCRVTYRTTVLGIDDLSINDQIIAYLENRLAYQVIITSRTQQPGEYILGTITEIRLSTSGNFVQIRDKDGNLYTYMLSSNVRVTFRDTVLRPEDIGWGDTVRLRIEDRVAVEVMITARYQGADITGVVYGVTTGHDDAYLDIRQDSGASVRVRVNEKTRVIYGNTTLAWTDIQLRDRVEVKIENQEAVEVKILARNVEVNFGDIGGKIVSLSQSLDETVIVVEENALRYTVRLSPQIRIWYGDTQLSRYDLRIGDVVRVRLENQVAVEMMITSRGPAPK